MNTIPLGLSPEQAQPLKVNATIQMKETGGPSPQQMMRRIGTQREDGTEEARFINCWRCCSTCDAIGVGNVVWDSDGIMILCLCTLNLVEMIVGGCLEVAGAQ